MVEYEADDALAAAAATAAARSARSSACSSARPTRISRSASAARASCRWIRRTRDGPRRSGRHREVRRAAGVDPRLPRAGRRLVRRLSGPAGLGARNRRRRCSRNSGTSKSIPDDPAAWSVNASGRRRAGANARRATANCALLFRDLATLRTDIPLFDSVDALRWNGPTAAFPPLAARLDAAVSAGYRRPGVEPSSIQRAIRHPVC